MAMSEALATTGAQTIPVFALAGVIEIRAALQGNWISNPTPRTTFDVLRARVRAWLKMLSVAAWAVAGLVDFVAEGVCLEYLRVGHATGVSQDWLVVFAMEGSLALLVLYPVVAAYLAGERKSEEVQGRLRMAREVLRGQRRRNDDTSAK